MVAGLPEGHYVPRVAGVHCDLLAWGGRLSDISIRDKIEGIFRQDRRNSGKNRGPNQPKIRETYILNVKQLESDKWIVKF